jgi:D-glycero-alpha-D-manno-heptose-7-phosphate kinase
MDLALEAIDIEKNMLRESVGVQDQIAAAFGGLNVISFSRNGQFEVSPMVVRSDRLEAFESNLMLFYTGISRFASEIAAKKISAIPSKTKTLKRMYEMVDEARLILASGDLDHFGSLLDEGWSLKKSISSVISNQQIDEIYERAKAAGAIGGKILGAGGGGFLLFYVPMERKGEVRQALSTLLEVPVKFERQGSQIIFYDPPPQ